jgi:hypothetical protein
MMNLRKILFRAEPAATLTNVAQPAPLDAVDNVIQLPGHTPLNAPSGLNAPLTDDDAPATAQPPRTRGLLDAPELKAFFEENYFGLGRHNGAHYRTQEAQVQGKQSIVAAFQNVLAEQVERKQAKADRLHDKWLETQGLCATTTARLQLARTQIEREMEMLQAQIASAADHKGWVLEALNRYQTGFGKGLREAIAFELLAD